MSFNPLAGDYAPQDPYKQYHGQPEAERQRAEYLGQIRGTGAISGGSYGQQNTLRSSSAPLMSELQQMEKNLHALHTAIDMLTERLSTVLLGPPVASPFREEKQDRPHSSLTAQMVAFNGFLQNQTSRVEQITGALDL